MSEKKALVVYYSRTGNTKKVAEAVAGQLGCDVERIEDTKDRTGLTGWFKSGRDALRRKETVIGPPQRDPAAYDLVLIGTPVWAWTVTPAVRAYITAVKDKLPDVGFFATAGGCGFSKTFRHMEGLCGKAPVATLGLTEKPVKRDQYAEDVRAFVGKLGA